MVAVAVASCSPVWVACAELEAQAYRQRDDLRVEAIACESGELLFRACGLETQACRALDEQQVATHVGGTAGPAS